MLVSMGFRQRKHKAFTGQYHRSAGIFPDAKQAALRYYYAADLAGSEGPLPFHFPDWIQTYPCSQEQSSERRAGR
jgi:hypothetical protein